MRNILFLILALSMLFQSCKVGTSGSWIDENIPTELKNEINKLDKAVVKAVTDKNSDHLKANLSKVLIEKSGKDIDNLIEQIANVISNPNYQVLNQFYVKNTTTGVGNTVISGVGETNDYVIHYQALNKEMFISILIPQDSLDELIITNIYGKYPDGWKLNILQFGQYKINGRTAPELYLKAKSEYEKGYLIDAGNDMFLNSIVAKPANNFWQYQNEKEMKKFYETVMSEIKTKYVFPFTINEIKSAPKIVNIFPQGTRDGYFPMIEYLTNIDLHDTTKTKAENNLIHQSIGNIFEGIDKDKKFIFYKAFNEIPNGTKEVQTYGFVKELK
jgi:hypothetical protein